MFSGVTLLGFDLRPFMVVRYQVYPLNVKNMTKSCAYVWGNGQQNIRKFYTYNFRFPRPFLMEWKWVWYLNSLLGLLFKHRRMLSVNFVWSRANWSTSKQRTSCGFSMCLKTNSSIDIISYLACTSYGYCY